MSHVTILSFEQKNVCGDDFLIGISGGQFLGPVRV